MRRVLALAAFSLVCGVPAAAAAQGAPPPGSYQQHCSDIRMNGMYLSAWCRGSHGSGQSTINVRSCASDIGVDRDGGLICVGPGAVRPPPPPPVRPPPPGWSRPPGGRESPATLFEGPNFRGRSMAVHGEMSNLDRTGFNDRVGSIRFARRAGPWQICTDSRFRGRCVVVRSEVRNTARIGMANSVSSLRPMR